MVIDIELNKKHKQCYSICEERFKDSPLSEYEIKCCKSSCRIYKYQALVNFWQGEKRYYPQQIELLESRRLENLKKLKEEKIKYKAFAFELKKKKKEYKKFKRGQYMNNDGVSFTEMVQNVNKKLNDLLEQCYKEKVQKYYKASENVLNEYYIRLEKSTCKYLMHKRAIEI